MNLFLYESLSAGGLGDDAPRSLCQEGWAMLSSAAGDFAKVAHVSTLLSGEVADIPGIRCLRTSAAEERRRFAEMIAESDAVLLIAPEFDDILARRSEQVLTQGRRLLGCRPDAVRATADKFALARFWGDRSVPTPLTDIASNEPPRSFPVVLKPRDGAGSMATRLIVDAASWSDHLAAARAEMPGSELIVQPYHPGKACSVAYLVGPRQTLPLVPTEQRISNDGRLQYLGGRLPLTADEARRAVELATAAIEGMAGLAGYVGVDLILGGDGTDVAIEVNPRLTVSSIGLRALCRDSLAAAWLRLLDGERGVELSWRPGPIAFFADGRAVV